MAHVSLVLVMVLSCIAGCVQGFNITAALEPYTQYSLFNQWLTNTGVINEVNNRTDVTVLVTSNSVFQSYLSGVPGYLTMPRLVADTLRYNVLLTYYSPVELAKLPLKNGTSVTTLLQTTGRTNDTDKGGFVDIYNKGNQTYLIGHFIPDSVGNVTIVTNVTQSSISAPTSYSILEVSSVLVPLTPIVAAPLPAPTIAPAPATGLTPTSSPPAPPAVGTPITSPSTPSGNHGSTTNAGMPLTLLLVSLVCMASLL